MQAPELKTQMLCAGAHAQLGPIVCLVPQKSIAQISIRLYKYDSVRSVFAAIVR